ncbi:MAG: MotA/TolQ/ExbB proton channel family protein [Pseudomonadota bacterium]
MADSFDDLLKSIQQQSREQLAQEDARVKKFAEEKKNRESMLKSAQQDLADEKKLSQSLNQQIDENEVKLVETEEQLQRKLGDLGELFGAVRQASGELIADLDRSIVNIQFPERGNTLDDLAQSRELPSVAKLEELWYIMMQEMGETGKTRTFTTSVVATDGTISERDITRVGAYALLSNGLFLQHNQETNSSYELQRQPALRFSSTAESFENGTATMSKLAIDPTRGQLLDLLVLKPTLIERIHQGGVIGYVILALGALGLLIALLRYIYLSVVSLNIWRQSKNLSNPSSKNPLGRIALVYKDNESKPLNERELALEEAIVRESPGIERYNGLIKLLAAVSPLLGLLGTVIGMIITFQSITLFGTSDPKLMAGGISTALVTTVLGLTAAIPLLFAHTFIQSKSRKILDVIEHQSIGLIARS